MSGSRKQRMKRKDQEFKQRMEAMKQEEEEDKRINRQHRSVTKKSTTSTSDAAPIKGFNDKKISNYVKNEEEHCEKEMIDSQSNLFERSKESPQNRKTSTRATPSSRFDDFDARNVEQNIKHKSRRELVSNDYNDEGSRDTITSNEKYKRTKRSSPFYKSAGAVFSSPARSKKKYANRQEWKTRDGNGDISSVNSNSVASPSSIASPHPHYGVRSQRSNYRLDNATGFNGTKTIAREKVSSSSQSITMSQGEPVPIDATRTTESDHESDSDGSFNILSLFKQRKKSGNQEAEQETPESERSDKLGNNKISNTRRRNLLNSSSEDDEQGDLKDRNENSRLRRNNKNKKIPRKGRATEYEYGEYSGERNLKRIRESTSLGNKDTVNRAKSSNIYDSEGSVMETDDDEKQQSIRQHRNKKPRNPMTSTDDINDQLFPAVVGMKTNTKLAPESFLDDDDDGFMSDCDPSSAPLTGRSVKEDTTSGCRKKLLSQEDHSKRSPKKKGKSKQNNEKIFAFDSNDSQHEKYCDGALDDLHPNFKDPKFGPYEPVEPLLLSNDSNGTVIQVPASLSRFLAPFQREGVQFMYDCLARKSGVILGDEMGCGKTVQVISLLCALFKKTGTRKDFLDIRDRNSLVHEQILKVQKLKDEALRMGEELDENIEEWKTSLSLSPWNPVMIIVPPTILDTWKDAFKTFSHFSVSFYSSKTKVDAINSLLYGSADILIVPKSAFQDEKHLNELERVKWKLVVIDEFHNFKNYKAKISIHLRQLKQNQLHQPLILGMTGTPMQNNHTELWNLVDLIETNCFGTKDEFKINIDRPITLGRHKCADPRAKARSKAASAELRKGLNKIYIKRSKKDVLKGQVPDKSEDFILCDLSPLQREVYRHVVKLPDFDLVKHGSRPCDCGINQNFFRKLLKLEGKAEQLEYMRTNKSKIVNQSKCCKTVPINPRYGEEGEPYIDQDATIWRTLDAHCSDDTVSNKGCDRCPWCCALPCLTKLNKLSSHLGLLQANKTTEVVGSPAYIAYKKEREFAKVALAGVVDKLPGGDYDRNDGIMDDHFNLSGKIRVLNDLLQREYDEGGKVLLFSHSTKSLDLIENWLKSRGSFEYRRMDGSTPLSRRQHLADEFNNTKHIFLFLLSIKATGLGLNLTSANRVIMFDVSWNPSWEIQAQDRAHRIGQTRDVRVMRLISKGTVEEMIYLRQIYKEHLKQDTLQENDSRDAVAPRVFRGVQGDKYRKGEIFGTENLFRFKEEGSFLHDIYNVQPKLRNRGDGESSDLEIHESGKVSEMLLGMTDKGQKKVGEEDDDLVILKAISRKSVYNTPRESSGSIGPQGSRSIDDNHVTDKRKENKFLAINHQDLFRSDRGGAAINSGEVGFDEEMGGQTQAAFEIYENVKENLCKETGNSDVDIVDDNDNDKDCSKQDIEGANHRDQSDITLRDESEVSEKIDKTQTTSMKTPIFSSIPTIPQATSDKKILRRGAFSSSAVMNANDKRKLALDSTPAVHKNCRKEIFVSQNGPAKKSCENTFRDSYQTKKKVLLMGFSNIDDVKTEFSAADLRRPMYGRKKKKEAK